MGVTHKNLRRQKHGPCRCRSEYYHQSYNEANAVIKYLRFNSIIGRLCRRIPDIHEYMGLAMEANGGSVKEMLAGGIKNIIAFTWCKHDHKRIKTMYAAEPGVTTELISAAELYADIKADKLFVVHDTTQTWRKAKEDIYMLIRDNIASEIVVLLNIAKRDSKKSHKWLDAATKAPTTWGHYDVTVQEYTSYKQRIKKGGGSMYPYALTFKRRQ